MPVEIPEQFSLGLIFIFRASSVGLRFVLHWRGATVAPSSAFVKGSQPLAGTTTSLGAVKVLSLVVFDSGMNTLEAWRLAALPSIHESTAQHVAHMSFGQSFCRPRESQELA